MPVPGVVSEGSFYKTLEAAQSAIYAQEERSGQVWVKNQSKTKGGQLKKMTFRCNRHSLPNPKHDVGIDPAEHRHGKSGRTGCQAHVNVCRNGAGWLVTTADWRHNHERTVPNGGSVRRPPTQEQRSVIANLATVSQGNFTRTQIGAIVKNQASFEKVLEPRQISNIMCQARRDTRNVIQALGGDVNVIAETLRRREEEEGWRFNLKVNEAGTVVIIWWQTRQQFELIRRYPDILLNDNTYNRNNTNYPLNIGIIIDSQGRSRNGWYALQEREDAASFSWILRNHLDATGGITPEVFASDRHASLIKSVSDTLPLTRHIFCLQHLGGNIGDHARRVLGSDFNNFTQDFWATYRAISPDEFERLWRHLTARYPAIQAYLDEEIYPCREQWAWAWMSSVFTAGIRTNGRVESENRVTKSLGGPKTSLFTLFNALNERSEGQTIQELERVRNVSNCLKKLFCL